MATLEVLQQRLADAENALHTVTLGGQATAIMDQNGERIEYSRTSPGALTKYIAMLNWQISQLTGSGVTGAPLRPVFGGPR